MLKDGTPAYRLVPRVEFAANHHLWRIDARKVYAHTCRRLPLEDSRLLLVGLAPLELG